MSGVNKDQVRQPLDLISKKPSACRVTISKDIYPIKPFKRLSPSALKKLQPRVCAICNFRADNGFSYEAHLEKVHGGRAKIAELYGASWEEVKIQRSNDINFAQAPNKLLIIDTIPESYPLGRCSDCGFQIMPGEHTCQFHGRD